MQKELSEKEINKLPLVHVHNDSDSSIISARYDKRNNTLYCTDPDGQYNGTIIRGFSVNYEKTEEVNNLLSAKNTLPCDTDLTPESDESAGKTIGQDTPPEQGNTISDTAAQWGISAEADLKDSSTPNAPVPGQESDKPESDSFLSKITHTIQLLSEKLGVFLLALVSKIPNTEKLQEKIKKSPNAGYLVMISLLIIGLCFYMMTMYQEPSQKHDPPPLPPAESTIAAEPVSPTSLPTQPPQPATETCTEQTTQPAPEMVELVYLNTAVFPGEQIQKGQLATKELPISEYQAIQAAGNQVMTADRMDSLVGIYATAYIQKGAFLSANVVATQKPPVVNPWLDSDAVTHQIKVNRTWDEFPAYQPGTIVDWTITVAQTEIGAWTEDQDNAFALPGVEYNPVLESTVIKKIVVSDIVIQDMLDEQGRSLYESIRRLADIPEIIQKEALQERYATADSIRKLAPYTLVGTVTEEQKLALDNLAQMLKNQSGVEIKEISVVSKGHVEDTIFQREAYMPCKVLFQNISDVWGGHENAEK